MERQQYPNQPYAHESHEQTSYPQRPITQQTYVHQPYAQHGAPYPVVPPRARSVNDILPSAVPAVLGGLQVVLWLAIIGLEAGGLSYDPWRGTAYAACKTIDLIDVTGDILGIIGLGCRAKLPILKGLLACAILMFLSSITYIIAYIAISIWLCKKETSNTVHTEAVYQSSVDSVTIRQQQPDSLTRGYEHTGPPENHRP
ncbi:unnamed protein product [Adineta steineri]|uniref:Uncharacterized protein n=1 Tax=Adineta steineri TaxID=433720 RepID=A0A813YQK0_9BILA|nr:unnamed protein product [Adineta steineri]CAF0887573.1 unnamed protein product [Adineta steineri]CAF3516057.1 unnamed protein product [Adineta steineri]CAF3717017.1 unnamed protein product [Adineta steineri]